MSEIKFSESKRFFSDYSPVNRSEMVRVRREIRDLSSSEWNTVVRALWVMKNSLPLLGLILKNSVIRNSIKSEPL